MNDKNTSFNVDSNPKSESSSWKPSKLLIGICCALFVAVGIADKIMFDLIFDSGNVVRSDGASKFHVGIIFLFDAFGRILIAAPFVFLSGKISFTSLRLKEYLKVFLCRFVLQLGFQIGAMSILGIGAGTASVFQQTQVAFVALFSYFVLGRTPTSQQVLHAAGICLLAVAFKANHLDFNSENKGALIGFVLIIISVIMVSFIFTILERVLKETLEKVRGWDKQMLFAMADVPAMFIVLTIAALWEIYYCGYEHRSFNFFEHLDMYAYIQATICVAFGILMWFLFDWMDAMFVNLLLVVVTALTWPLEVALKFESFDVTRMFILVAILIACVGYHVEDRLEEKRKDRLETLEKTADLTAVYV